MLTLGRVVFEGTDITGLPPHEIAGRGIARSFQQTYLFMHSTVLENVLIGFHMHCRAGAIHDFLHTPRAKRTDDTCRSQALEIIDFRGLSSVKHELAGNLPHGHQRALGVSIALAYSPTLLLLLLDEPVTGMNPTETAEMVERIRRIRDRTETAGAGDCGELMLRHLIAPPAPAKRRRNVLVISSNKFASLYETLLSPATCGLIPFSISIKRSQNQAPKYLARSTWIRGAPLCQRRYDPSGRRSVGFMSKLMSSTATNPPKRLVTWTIERTGEAMSDFSTLRVTSFFPQSYFLSLLHLWFHPGADQSFPISTGIVEAITVSAQYEFSHQKFSS